tara:strand:+ start:57005 stop:58330 length:1326 start_codon:yes stop_codon:yes gene_type:complete
MNSTSPSTNAQDDGKWMHDLLVRLFPICRSLAGPGNRETLAILGEHLPLKITEVPSGTDVFGWTVPDEWTPRGAEITAPDGTVYARFADHNLHLVNGSRAIETEMGLSELNRHLYSLPDKPDLIPYVTSYYHPHWGFCLSDREKAALPPGRYKVRIDTEHKPGALVYGEAVLPGAVDDEVLISTYICHPSMANDNLSGVVMAVALYRRLSETPDRHYTYRFVFTPETIGAMCWLMNNETTAVPRIHAGLVLSCLGEDDKFSYKQSRRGNTEIDRIARSWMRNGNEVLEFFPTGSDERQYGSPGFNLPVGLISRPYPGEWPYYHTSGDTPDRVTAPTLGSSLDLVFNMVMSLEWNSWTYHRTDPRGEPMLSKHDLYHRQHARENYTAGSLWQERTAMLWLLNLADGEHDLIDVAEKSGNTIAEIAGLAERLLAVGLLSRNRP